MTCCDAESEEELYAKLSKLSFPVMIWNGGLDPGCKSEDCLRVAQAILGAVFTSIRVLVMEAQMNARL